MLAAEKPPLEEAYLEHISERPWSTYTKVDYTIQQWHAACLIHQHEGVPTSKEQCKLPVRTPNGALNRNGVHSALAALNGARGGVDATAEQKAVARNALARFYKELGEDAPGDLAKHGVMTDEELLIHFGVKGMHWGQVKEDPVGPGRHGLSSTNQKLVTAAAIAGGVAAAAIMLKTGKIPVWNSTSTKIAMKGASTSANILGKVGKVLVRSSAKTAVVGSKVAFKTGKITGKLAGKAAVAGGKAAGRAAAKNGTEFYKEILQPTGKTSTKLGSHVMFQLTGRGTPWVSEAVKRPMSKNPIDLLLNIRADRSDDRG